MAESFLGEIKIVAFNFPPKGWATCDGQILPIAQNQALFSLLGTYYGGNGVNTFALPDLRGRAPIHQGQGPGLTNRSIGENGGSESVQLTVSQIPSHIHTVASANVPVVSSAGNMTTPSGNRPAKAGDGESNYSSAASDGSIALGGNTDVTGGSQPHNNMPPFLTLNFVIALVGIFPSRN
jgi:microcystin-dependent protein